jgi:hypothetical protein
MVYKKDIMPIQWEYYGNISMILQGYNGDIGYYREIMGILRYWAFQQQMYTHISIL